MFGPVVDGPSSASASPAESAGGASTRNDAVRVPSMPPRAFFSDLALDPWSVALFSSRGQAFAAVEKLKAEGLSTIEAINVLSKHKTSGIGDLPDGPSMHKPSGVGDNPGA